MRSIVSYFLGGKSAAEYGFEVLVEGIEPTVDIITIHGLDGHRLGSFSHGDVCWPQSLLPSECPRARIASYGYNAAIQSDESQISSQSLHQHGMDLLTKLAQWRSKTGTKDNRPIMFIAHSTGGLVLKHALIMANDERAGSPKQKIKLATYGIIFLGTPQQGIPPNVICTFLKHVSALARKAVIRDVESYSEHIYAQLDNFANISSDFVIKFAYETLGVKLPDGKTVTVVPYATAVLPSAVNCGIIGMQKNHHTIARFTSATDGDFVTMSGWLQEMITDACERIHPKFVNATPPTYESACSR